MRASERVMIIIMLFWAGFVSSISFMEAWLKFRADGVTREIGLSIGKLIFTALNRVEIILLISVWILRLSQKLEFRAILQMKNAWLWIISAIIALQSFWLLPQLSHNAQLIIDGTEMPSSLLHVWFGLFELTKVSLLLLVSFKICHRPMVR
ncbi:hypothetical protein SAMN06265379_10778 [Saccharicrinis carchari]|uniref:DUF4149 domain-containing protein n=1 Tax=Saccharicrinis carchari TaxID=1168039 RepID=A0A521DZU7_SACCC|nr:hypothetical protein [Saccharicrinis carchari]SMO77224.1 hypothetical protein SAMN06265379_10778 [Saccharicrinis carchari]